MHLLKLHQQHAYIMDTYVQVIELELNYANLYVNTQIKIELVFFYRGSRQQFHKLFMKYEIN